MIHKDVEVYVDDMMVKSKTKEGHPNALKKFLIRVEKYSLRLNSNYLPEWNRSISRQSKSN